MITLEKVTKIYPDGTDAVQNLSLEIGKGNLCVLLGPSGCGKTTTMKMINRLISITEGKISIDGVDNQELDENDLRRDIGYAIQEIGLFPHMTVVENIATVPALKGWPKEKRRERAKELLELMGMNPEEFLNKYPSELSGGQRQRVGVARSLGADPPIMLMDEPFGAIDPITRDRLQDEFLKIQEEIKKTIVFVTHDINEAIKMGDKIALMKQGELIQYDSPAVLLSQPNNKFVRDFVGADRALKGLRLMRVKEVMQKNPPTVKVDDDTETIKKLMDKLEADWLMVINNQKKFLGWVGRSDLENGKRVKDIVIPPVNTGTPDTVLNEALSLMLGSATGNLAIIDVNDKLVGLLAFDAIREILSAVHAKERSN